MFYSMADATAASATGWLPVFTLLLGAGITLVATVITSLLQHRLTSQRERETRRELRRDQLAERRADFQRETLIQLQEATTDLSRAVGWASGQDETAFEQTGQWGKREHHTDVDVQANVAMGRTLMFMVRLRDRPLRDLVEEFRIQVIQVLGSTDKQHSHRSFANMQDEYEKVQRRLGELLRTLDDEESSTFTG
ncbi:MAG: hypothetical protein DMG96_17365 [Acidobacteria bacterium]|nr:MAG: hypothetical protein DMG96_17365 [Acidobacteriota bacterium]